MPRNPGHYDRHLERLEFPLLGKDVSLDDPIPGCSNDWNANWEYKMRCNVPSPEDQYRSKEIDQRVRSALYY